MISFGYRGPAWAVGLAAALFAGEGTADTVRTRDGAVRGLSEPDVRVFRGIPYAAPPVGDLRWREPQPVAPWKGVRETTRFGPRCVQGPIFDDMVFRDQPGEDCLYLNVWTPARSAGEKLPVMVWIHGGGFQAGSASEPRQDGARLARKGVVVVSLNYRLGVFGFLAHPELTMESAHGASGNYGLLDQVAALRWVRDNAAAFGGDPARVTIFGESAGSFAVSALMASPLARGLFHRAIGESGAYLGRSTGLALSSLAAEEAKGSTWAASIGAGSVSALRTMPADEVLQPALKVRPEFNPTIDGHALPRDPNVLYAAGEQAHVPLLAGWNADESRAEVVLAKTKPTAASFVARIRREYGPAADSLLVVFPAASDAEALESAAALEGDLFIGLCTWKWTVVHGRTGGSPVYRYSFDRKIPVAPGTKVGGVPATAADVGARHAGEIEYVFGALDTVEGAPWEPADRRLSDLMMTYWSNFARTGDPNGAGLPKWPLHAGPEGPQVMHLDVTSHAAPDALKARYEALDAALTAAVPAK
jgi:para-nitrobenzyl esterase